MSGIVGGLLLIAGAAFVLVGAVGVVRFESATEHLHAAAKGPTLGLMLLAAGTAVRIGSTAATAAVVLIVLLQLIAGPLGSHMIGRMIYRDDEATAPGRGDRAVEAPD